MREAGWAPRSVVERGARGAPEGDPWLGEARCVAAGRAVAAAGSAERGFLDRAFARVCELEMRRAGTLRSTVGTCVRAYRRGPAAARQQAAPLMFMSLLGWYVVFCNNKVRAQYSLCQAACRRCNACMTCALCQSMLPEQLDARVAGRR